MSRARVHEVSSPISLFPFIGILLCTMGALLVVLVAVSRSARDTAQRAVRAKQASVPAVDETMQKKLDYVQNYMGSLQKVRTDAEHRLREEHARLSHVEDHIRRLQEKMRALQLAAGELHELEKEHYDDREQAERETARLNRLIDESRTSIASLQQAADQVPSSYAVVPYEGPNGTYRRPVYIECVKDGVVLQPEGVRIPVADLQPPYGAGNPLAAVLRASRDHLVRLYPKEGQRRELEPYPLLLVRSQGLLTFDRARQAIDAGDFDLGFELVEDHWQLKFPPPDPQLANLQQQTLEQARARQQILAAAAPRAYRGRSMSVHQRYGVNDEPPDDADDEADSQPFADGTGGGMSDGNTASGRHGSFAGGGNTSMGDATGGNGFGGEAGGLTAAGGTADPSGGGSSPLASAAGPSASGGPSGSMSGSGGASLGPGISGVPSATSGGGGSALGSSPAGPTAMDDAAAPPGSNGSQGTSVMVGGAATDYTPGLYEGQSDRNQPSLADTRGKDWALRQKPQRATPVRRTIHVIVRQDRLAILPDGSNAAPHVAAGKVVPLPGDTVESLDEFVNQVRDHIDGWGMAGNGLYWRPVIELTVGPEGQRRAGDLQRLLRNSGLDLRVAETANNSPPRNVQ